MKLIPFIFILFLFAHCKVEPEALSYGKDGCYSCKMTLMDNKFGGEFVTQKGKIYKFDDVNCMINFLNSGEISERDIAFRLVINFNNPGNFIEAGDAFYLRSEKIKSPMASKIAAFSSKPEMDSIKNKVKGIYLTWGELVTEYK